MTVSSSLRITLACATFLILVDAAVSQTPPASPVSLTDTSDVRSTESPAPAIAGEWMLCRKSGCFMFMTIEGIGEHDIKLIDHVHRFHIMALGWDGMRTIWFRE